MSADLRHRAKALDTSNGTTYNVYDKLLAWRTLAYEAIEHIEEQARATVTATGYNPDSPGFDACVDAVKWSQQPLNCQGIEINGKGKIESRERAIEKGGQGIHL